MCLIFKWFYYSITELSQCDFGELTLSPAIEMTCKVPRRSFGVDFSEASILTSAKLQSCFGEHAELTPVNVWSWLRQTFGADSGKASMVKLRNEFGEALECPSRLPYHPYLLPSFSWNSFYTYYCYLFIFLRDRQTKQEKKCTKITTGQLVS